MDTPQATYKITVFKADTIPEAYKNFIYSRYLRSLKYGNDWFGEIDPDAYYKVYHLLCEKMLLNPASIIRIAQLTDDDDLILGFSISRNPDILDYVYVKREVRNNGIGKSLLPKTFNIITHLTKQALQIRASKYKGTVFNPFI
jgi:predicted GNAT family N-acyltransferase